MSTTFIKIAKDFSRSPAGRYVTDGDFSGERFRDKWLLPALRGAGDVTVNLDDTAGYGSSFLEEAFGGLVRNGCRLADLEKRLKIESARPSYRVRVWQYIRDAAAS